MTRFWHFLRHIFSRSPADDQPHVVYDPRRDETVRWLQRQRHISEKSERRIRTLSEEVFPDQRKRA